jgi:NAD(P)-dependent dehydrogenase (short-subunit alcohol dehydrogenase family)
MTKHLLPLLRKSKSGGRVINIGSIHGIAVPVFETYAYSASKAALHHLTKHLASRLAPENITVNAVACGFFPSKMTQEVLAAGREKIMESIPLRRGGEPSDIGGMCIFLTSKAASWITGTVLPLDGGSLVLSSL